MRGVSMPHLIKKYSNRRMYDTKTSQPITLTELAQLIKQGEEIQVIAHPTRRDLTSITLIQILLGQEKHKKELFSALLRELIKKSGNSLLEPYPTSLLVTLNDPSFSAEKARRIVRQLMNKKRVSITEGQKLLESLRTRIQENKKALEREIEDKLKRKMKEVESHYQRQISELRKNVENLRELLGQRKTQKSRES